MTINYDAGESRLQMFFLEAVPATISSGI